MAAPAERRADSPTTWDACIMAAEKQLADEDADVEVHPDWGLIPLVELSYEEGFAVLDGQARRRLNMSGDEFLRRWKEDDFSEEFKDAHHSAFAALSILVRPFANDDAP
jgi:hypothetical protein